MMRLIAMRLLGGLGVLFIVATMSFFILRAAPGGPFDTEGTQSAEARRNQEARFGLDQPLAVQYKMFLGKLVTGKLQSNKRTQTVGELIKDHVGYSATLGSLAMLFAVLFGTTLGVIAAWKRNSWLDHGLMSTALIGISIPSFVLAPIFILVFSLQLRWLPAARAADFTSYILPAVTLGMIYAGTVARLAREGMIETLGQDFIRTAKAKGVGAPAMLVRHALRIGVTPVVTYIAPALSALITGSFVIEKIFQIPGLGFYFVASVGDRDYEVLSGLLVFYVSLVVIANLIVDILYGVLDPRVRSAR